MAKNSVLFDGSQSCNFGYFLFYFENVTEPALEDEQKDKVIKAYLAEKAFNTYYELFSVNGKRSE